jgi:hypothetical protein
MPTPTYTALANITLGSSASSVTFSSIPATYRDLVVIITAQRTGSPTNMGLRFNGDSGSNYSQVFMTGTGSATDSGPQSGTNAQIDIYPYAPSTGFNNYILQIMDYSATDKHKTMLRRTNEAGNATEAAAHRWANTAAITSMTFLLANFNTGSTLALYGIAS